MYLVLGENVHFINDRTVSDIIHKWKEGQYFENCFSGTILVTSCCTIHYPKTYRLKQWKTLCHTRYVIQNFGSSLAGWFWLRMSLDVLVKMLARVTVLWKFDWGWQIHFQVGSLTCSCWLLAGGFLSPLYGPFSKAVWMSSIYGNQFLPEITANDPRTQDGSHDVFYDPTLKVSYHHCHNILLVAPVSLIYCGRGCISAHTGSHLESWLP